MKIRLFSGPGTRRWPRFSISDVPSIREIKSAAGSRIDVVDISRGGALLRTPRRLLPGTRIRLNAETSEGSIPVAGLVLRSSDFNMEGGAQYQAAVVFDRPLQIPDECRKQTEGAFQEVAHNPDGDISTIEDFLAIDFCSEPGSFEPEMLRLNDW
ncbi:MAG: PilZ domain-containing protein [Acidobacteria bacterium]|nr:PilZ domain-containing protein [Acidobacteriota bacterium]